MILMTVEIVLPEINSRKKNVKDLVFSVLLDCNPKTLTQLHREIKQKYNISVSFQAVLKAVNILYSEGILSKEGKFYSINKRWIFETRNFFDKIYMEHFSVKKPMKKIEMGKDVTIYTVSNLFELDRLWWDLLMNWAKNEKEDKRNVFRGSHCWWLLLRLYEDFLLQEIFDQNKIKTYNLISKNTPLDKVSVKYHKSRGIFAKINTKIKEKINSDISSFGAFLLKCEIPIFLYQKLEKIYIKSKSLQDLDLKEITDIFNENTEIELRVIKDKFLADKVKEDVIGYF